MSPAAQLVVRIVALAVAQGVSRRSRPTVEQQAPWLFDKSTRPKRRRKPPEAGMPVPAIPPKGPLPMQGGAQAPLEFRED